MRNLGETPGGKLAKVTVDLGYDGESAPRAAKVRVLLAEVLGAPYDGESDRGPGLRWRKWRHVPTLVTTLYYISLKIALKSSI